VPQDQGSSIRGRVVDAAADFVTLRRSSDRVGVKYSDIVVIEEVDDLKNSAVVGLIVGAALFVADVWASSHDGITLNTAGYSVFQRPLRRLWSGRRCWYRCVDRRESPDLRRGGTGSKGMACSPEYLFN
jgi:hypothetical protein